MVDRGTITALALAGYETPAAVIEVPAPVPGVGEVLVRVGAASVNAYDTFVAMGAMKDYMPYEFPAVLGMDLAGTVREVGTGVESLKPGDRVFGTIGMKGSIHDGSFGEFATPQEGSLAKTPASVDDANAGSLGVAGTTAMSAVDAVDPAQGARILIVGATGGVGSFAIQLAASRGAQVIASVRPGDEGFVTGLGAAETVDYTGDLLASIRERYPDGVDGAIDAVNRDPAAFATLAALVHRGGHAVSALGGAGEASDLNGVTVSNVGSNPDHLDPLAAMVAAGTLKVAIKRTYPLTDAAQALQGFTNEHTLGKLVITM